MGLWGGKAAKKQAGAEPALPRPVPAEPAGLPGMNVYALSLLGGRKTQQDVLDYRLLPAPPGAPCPRDALRVCRLLKLDDALMGLVQAHL